MECGKTQTLYTFKVLSPRYQYILYIDFCQYRHHLKPQHIFIYLFAPERLDSTWRHPSCVCSWCLDLLSSSVFWRREYLSARSDHWTVWCHFIQQGGQIWVSLSYLFVCAIQYKMYILPTWTDWFLDQFSASVCVSHQGAAVLRMLSDFLSEPVFVQGLGVCVLTRSHTVEWPDLPTFSQREKLWQYAESNCGFLFSPELP